MKKIIISLMAALVALALAGCAGTSSAATDSGDAGSSADAGSGASGATTIEDLQDEWATYPQDILKLYDEVPETYDGLPSVTPDELKAAIDSGEPMVLIDTNSASVYSEGHIEGAINIPWDLDGFTQDPGLPRGVPLYFYCVCLDEADSGHMGLSAVRDWGYRNVKLLKGGTPAWEEAGYEMIPS